MERPETLDRPAVIRAKKLTVGVSQRRARTTICTDIAVEIKYTVMGRSMSQLISAVMRWLRGVEAGAGGRGCNASGG